MKALKTTLAALLCVFILAGCGEKTVPIAGAGWTGDPADFDIATYESPFVWDGKWDISDVDGTPAYSFTATNQSGKTITYFEIWTFYYDANGNPILDEYNTNWDWQADRVTLEHGESHTPRANGYWPLQFTGAEKIYYFVNYVEYDDGSWEGISDEQDYYTVEDILAAIDYINARADAWA